MSLQAAYRSGFFPSSGAALPTSGLPPYDSYWTDTSIATRVAAVWDTRSSSGFSSVTASWTYTGHNPPVTTTPLIRQYVFPAFGSALVGVMLANPGIAPAIGVASSTGSTVATQRTPINRSKGTITGGSGSRFALIAMVAKVVDSTGALRWIIGKTNAASGVNPFTGILTGRSYSVFTYTAGNQNLLPSSTDSLVIELGVSLRNYSPTPTTFDLEEEFGDSALSLLFNGDIAQNNSGFVLTYWINAAASTALGWTFTKPNVATISAKRMQATPAAVVDSDSLNELILN